MLFLITASINFLSMGLCALNENKLTLKEMRLHEVIVSWCHCVKSVQIRRFSGPYFPAMWENTDQKILRIWTLFTQDIAH